MENPGRGLGAWRRQGGGGEPRGRVGKENVEGEGSLEDERRGGREPEPGGGGEPRGRGREEEERRGGGGALRRGGGSAAVGVARGSSLRFLTRSALQPPSLACRRRWGLGSQRILSRAGCPGCPAAWVALGSARPGQLYEPRPPNPRRQRAGTESRRGLRTDIACKARVNSPAPKRT